MNTRTRFCYKILCVTGGLETRLYSVFYPGEPWKPGVRLSDRESAEQDSYDMNSFHVTRPLQIHRGIHVFWSLAAVKRIYGDTMHYDRVVIRVKCDRQDFVARDRGEAVFMKVRVLKRDFDAALRRAKKNQPANPKAAG